jgi:hypothetical protein
MLALLILSSCDTESKPTEDLTPREVEVSAAKSWQPSGFVLKPGDRATVEYVSGEWSHFPKEVPLYAGAYPPVDYVCADQIPAHQCVEPVPDYRSGALIGRTREELFKIGDRLTFTSTTGGPLLLRANDGDDGLYDNIGSIKVRVSIDRPTR